MRRNLFKLHSYAALFALLPLLIVSITGSILVFKSEIDHLLMPDVAKLSNVETSLYYVPQRLPLDALSRVIEVMHHDYVLGSWEIFDDRIEADRLYLIKKGTSDWYKAYFNPYTGNAMSPPVPVNSLFTDWLLNLHYTFLLNDFTGHSQFGTLLGLLIAIILSFLGISGLILHRKFWLALLKLRFKKGIRTITGDIHRLIGAWSSPIILIVGITGIYFNAVEYYHEAIEHGDEPHFNIDQPLYNRSIDLSVLYEEAKQQLSDFTPTYLLMPFEPEMHITFFGYQPGNNPLASNYASTVTYDKDTGKLIAAIDGREADAVTQVTDSFRKLHFGHFAGLTSKIIWSLLGFSPVFLAITGVYLWLNRRRKDTNKRKIT